IKGVQIDLPCQLSVPLGSAGPIAVSTITANQAGSRGGIPFISNSGAIVPANLIQCFIAVTPLPLAPPFQLPANSPRYVATFVYDVGDCAVGTFPIGPEDVSNPPQADDTTRIRDDGLGLGSLIQISPVPTQLDVEPGRCCLGATCLGEINSYCCLTVNGGSAWNRDATCANGCLCVTDADCDDGNVCTTDTCNVNGQCDHADNTTECDDGLFCTGIETCDPATGCQSQGDPCGGDICDEDAEVCRPHRFVWMSFKSATNIPGIGTIQNEDIVAYDLDFGTWSIIFDGSDVGLSGFTTDAMAVLPDDSIVLSFAEAGNISGMIGGPSGSVMLDDSDLVRFVPTSLGGTTAGTFEFYFDGSDVGLTNAGEDIDAVDVLPDGRILISPSAFALVPGAFAVDEDLLLFTPTSLGATTAGAYQLYIDGSDVGMSNSGTAENIDGAAMSLAGNFLFSTVGNFSVAGVSGSNEDVVEFLPTSTGATTAGAFMMLLDLSTLGINVAADIGSLEIVE
ncbi:MAG: hypothetical protein AABZ47_18145, partial [Planctomycetota bacterium]